VTKAHDQTPATGINKLTRRNFLGASTAAALVQVRDVKAESAISGTSDIKKRTGSVELQPATRVDGPAKVTGSARYPADEIVGPNLAYAALVTSAISTGRILSIDRSIALSVPGVSLVLDHTNIGPLPPIPAIYPKGQSHSVFQPFGTDEIRYSGQPIALVVADDLETARYAASLVAIDYESVAGSSNATITAELEARGEAAVQKLDGAKDPTFGDVETALANPQVLIDAEYETAIEHHNPIELYSSSAQWSEDGSQLTIYEPSQWLYGLRAHLAQQFGLQQDAVRIISRVVGGAFGGKALSMPHTVAVAAAARHLKRPVKLYISREQMFTIGSYRPGSRSRVRLAAQRDGKLLAIAHDYAAQTSRSDPGGIPGAEATVVMYDAPNVRGRDRFVLTDANAPGPMRAPVEMPSFFALESAMDELAVALNMDPIELRARNEPKVHPTARLPFSSRSLVECYKRGADIFGWSGRDPRPGSMREGDWLVGWGCASALYPTYVGPASVRMKLVLENRVVRAEVRLAGQDIGTGLATIVTQVAADSLGLPITSVKAIIGDSSLPFGSMAAGSRGTASVSPATRMAAEKVRGRLLEAATQPGRVGALSGRNPADVRFDGNRVTDGKTAIAVSEILAGIDGQAIEEEIDWAPPGMKQEALRSVQSGSEGAIGPLTETHAMYAFGAQFVELHIHRHTHVIRAPRMVGVFAAGRIMNRRTAHSQLMGGMIWGLASGLHEETLVDRRSGRYVNANLAEYLLPVCADIQDVTVEMLDEKDEVVNPLGIKGVGELGVVGMAAAVANAVYHATGKRIRHLPIHLDHLVDVS
jgi:xanthine dehydrogenase YagR molybdenum-binding subunit